MSNNIDNEKIPRISTPKDEPFPTPGSHVLLDLDNTYQVSHALQESNEDVILIPTPSADPDDPLNWSPRRKLLATCCWASYVFFLGVNNSNLYSILVPFSKASALPAATLNAGTGYLFLLAGMMDTIDMKKLHSVYLTHLTGRLGPLLLATLRPSIRQTYNLPHHPSSTNSSRHMGCSHQHLRPMVRTQYPSRLLRRTLRGTSRAHSL